MTDVALLGITVQTQGVADAIKQLNMLHQTTDSAEQSAMRFATAMRNADAPVSKFNTGVKNSIPAVNKAGKEMQNYGMHTANVFSQLNDIGIMMASGQNPFTLALQQGTQLNQVWGQMGGKVSSVKSVLAGAFTSLLNPMNLATIAIIGFGSAAVNWLFSAGEEAKTLDDRISDLEVSVTRMNEITKIYSTDGLQSLLTKYGEVDAALLQMIHRQTEFAQNQAMQVARDAVAAITDEYGGMLTMLEAGGRAGQAAFFEMNRELGLSAQEAIQLRDAINDANSATTFDQQAEALGRMNALLGQSKAGVTDVYGSALDAEDAIRQLANSSPQASWMNAAIEGVNVLIGRIGVAISAKSTLAGTTGDGKVYGQVGARGDPRQQGANAGGTNTFNVDNFAMPTGGGSSGGASGGGGTDPFQASLDRLIQSLMSEREIVETWYAESEVLLNDKRALEFMGEAEHKEAMLALEREYQDKISKIKDDSANFTLGNAADLFGQLNTLAGGGYDGLLRIQKSFAAAEALVNTYRAGAQVLADPTLPFFAKFAAVASIVAAGLGLVNSIKSGGGGGGASVSAPSQTTPSATTTQPARVVKMEFQGSDFMVKLAKELMEPLYEASANGAIFVK